MFRMYFITAFRRLAKEKIYVAINILSLALGIACFLILSLYLRSELTYDQHHTKHEQIYRIAVTIGNNKFAISQKSIGPLLTQDYPQLGEYVRFRRSNQNTLSHGDNRFDWDNVYNVDENIFEVFDHNILYGDPETALLDPYSIAISESVATSYFGDKDPVGEILEGDDISYRVTLVFADLPENSHLQYDAIYPFSIMSVFTPGYEDDYLRAGVLWSVEVFTYLLVPPDFDPESFPSIFDSFYQRYMAEINGQRIDATFLAEVQPLASIHFGEKLRNDEPNGNIFYVYGFSAVAIFILLVACINYVNLATARATKRASEVGMRKVVGANREQLIGQFIGESLVFTLGALLVGLLLVEIALNFTPIGSLMGKEELLMTFTDPAILLWVLLLSVVVSIASGLYPALYLSSISPMAALTKVNQSWRSGLSMRHVLVLLQLSISIGVIASTLLMGAQMRFVADRPLGFDTENRVLIRIRGADAIEAIPTLKNELIAHTNIIDVTETNYMPGTGSTSRAVLTETNEGVMSLEGADVIYGSLNYINALGVEVIEGRRFSEDVTTDVTAAVMVNESFVRKMGWDEPIGKRVAYPGVDNPPRVIGVTSDFHYTPLHNAIGALVIMPMQDDFGSLLESQRPLQSRLIVVNISGENIGATLETIESTIRQFDPDHIFDPVFLDDRLNQLYTSETNLMNLTEWFATICIMIAAMGLFGLAAFTTQQRYKEIGIRKVLGASSSQIVMMLTRYLIPLVLVAAIPSSIISFYALNSWLEKFAYRADINLLPFVIAIVAVLAVTLLTVGLQSFKTSQSNPVEALRYE